ncbi:WD40 repeat protein [Catenulispora sp. GP43]|uniref:caspase, EACC1-associated type n=1 Tax=Catenulispora sp. GP43 TaxID=3156263 RepID=UPI003511BF5E
MGSDPFRSRRAVLIANSRYTESTIIDLPAASASLTAMTDLLCGELCGWSQDELRTIADAPDPAALARLVQPEVGDVEDLLLVYYAGHGFRTMDSTLALALRDTDPHPELLPSTGMLYDRLAQIISGSPAKTKIVILDCCFAELANRGNHQIGSASRSGNPYVGLYFIGASEAEERASAPTDGSPTYFVQALIDVIGHGIDVDLDALSIEQVYRAVNERLRSTGLAEPVDSAIRGARDRPFARNARSDGNAVLTGPVEEIHSGKSAVSLLRRRGLLTAGVVGMAAVGTGWLGLRTLVPAGGSHSEAPPIQPITQATFIGAPLTQHTDMVKSVCFSPDNRMLASGGYDRTVRLWNVAVPANAIPMGAPLLGHTNHVSMVSISPDGRTLASAGEDTTIRLWDLTPPHPGSPGSVLVGHSAAVNAVAFRDDGVIAVSCSDDTTMRVWSIAGPALADGSGGPFGSDGVTRVQSVAFAARTTMLASAGGNGTAALWSLSHPTAPSLSRPVLSAGSAIVDSVALSPDGRLLAAGGYDENVRLWNLSDRRAAPTPYVIQGHSDAVTSVVFSPDGGTLASAGYDRTIRLWSLADPADPQPIGGPLMGHELVVFQVAFSPNGKLLASASGDNTIRLWALS